MTDQDMGLRLLAYTSRYFGVAINDDLTDIARVSWRNNPRHGITGALVFDAGRFIQVLEGPSQTIDRVFTTIQADCRAGEVETLFDTPIASRTLPEWTMWVGRVDGDFQAGATVSEELMAFRDAYLRTFKLDATGFVHLLRALLPTIEPLDAGPNSEGDP